MNNTQHLGNQEKSIGNDENTDYEKKRENEKYETQQQME